MRELPAGDGWAYEPKWDGFRGVLENAGGELRLWSRNGRPLLRYFPELRPLGDLLPPRSAIDGEIVIDVDGAIDFDAMQTRLHPAESRIRKLSAEIPARFIAFDVLVWNGAAIWQQPFAERRARSSGTMRPRSPSRPRCRPRDRAAWLDELEGLGLDGVVAKRLDRPVEPGGRGAVVKVKPERTADCVVVGLRWKSKPDRIATLLLGLYDDDGETRLRRLGGRRRRPPCRDRRAGAAAARRGVRTGASRSRTAGAAAGSRSSRCVPSSWPRCATTRCRGTASATARSSCASGPTRIRARARGPSCGHRASPAGSTVASCWRGDPATG